MNQLPFRPPIDKVRTIVVKVGSQILASPQSTAHTQRLDNLVADLVALHSAGIRVILVTSGAIAQGVLALKLPRRPSAIPLKQACASVGQIRLMRMYAQMFGAHGIEVGQVLLTWDDLRDKKRYLNLRNTLYQLLDFNESPVLN
jgi:glutamate 5-kinase